MKTKCTVPESIVNNGNGVFHIYNEVIVFFEKISNIGKYVYLAIFTMNLPTLIHPMSSRQLGKGVL